MRFYSCPVFHTRHKMPKICLPSPAASSSSAESDASNAWRLCKVCLSRPASGRASYNGRMKSCTRHSPRWMLFAQRFIGAGFNPASTRRGGPRDPLSMGLGLDIMTRSSSGQMSSKVSRITNPVVFGITSPTFLDYPRYSRFRFNLILYFEQAFIRDPPLYLPSHALLFDVCRHDLRHDNSLLMPVCST